MAGGAARRDASRLASPKRRAPARRAALALAALACGAFVGARSFVSPIAHRGPGRGWRGPVARAAAERVEGLDGALRAAGLDARASEGISWCEGQGAVTAEEVEENLEDFASALALGPEERRHLEVALRKHSQSPAQALLASEALMETADLLLQLRRGPKGEARLDVLAERLLAWLSVPGAPKEWDSFMGEGPIWDEAGIDRAKALESFKRTALLLTLGNNQADEVSVSGASGFSVSGSFGGAPVSLQLRRSPEHLSWGQWSGHYVSDGPPSLFGKRVVAIKRDELAPIFSDSGEIMLRKGDRLYVSAPDRAAVLEVATFDSLPNAASKLAMLIEQEDAIRNAHPDLPKGGILAPQDMLDAARFLRRMETMPGEEARQQASLRRLKEESPLVKELLRSASAKAEWEELRAAAEKWQAPLYTAMRDVSPKMAPIEPRKLENVSLNIPNLMIVMLVGVLIGAALFQGVVSLTQPQQTYEDLPLYGLEGTQPEKLAPTSSWLDKTLLDNLFGSGQ